MKNKDRAVKPFVYVPSKYEGIPGLIAIPISELEPSWNIEYGSITVDGEIVWTNVTGKERKNA
jgi:hypothetical protein